MRKLTLTLSTALAVTASSLAWAGATESEAARLGGELTPVGAAKEASKDGSIPAWSGATAKPQGEWKFGKNRGDVWNHKDEKSTLTINATNADKHSDKLSPGQLAMLKQLKGYEMHVFPSHRECS